MVIKIKDLNDEVFSYMEKKDVFTLASVSRLCRNEVTRYVERLVKEFDRWGQWGKRIGKNEPQYVWRIILSSTHRPSLSILRRCYEILEYGTRLIQNLNGKKKSIAIDMESGKKLYKDLTGYEQLVLEQLRAIFPMDFPLEFSLGYQYSSGIFEQIVHRLTRMPLQENEIRTLIEAAVNLDCVEALKHCCIPGHIETLGLAFFRDVINHMREYPSPRCLVFLIAKFGTESRL